MIDLKNISKTYLQGSQEVRALNNISFHLSPGEFCLLTGPSGCGKSTLLNILGGLDLPTEGEMFFQERSTARFTDREWTQYRRTQIGIVFQFFNLLPTLTVYENVSLPLVLNKTLRKEIDPKVFQFLERLSLTGKENRLPRDLSGGEMQRVAIARALVHSPSLLLADEPTGNLDSVSGRQILELVKSLSRENKMTVLMATHSPESSVFADRMIKLRDGVIMT